MFQNILSREAVAATKQPARLGYCKNDQLSSNICYFICIRLRSQNTWIFWPEGMKRWKVLSWPGWCCGRGATCLSWHTHTELLYAWATESCEYSCFSPLLPPLPPATCCSSFFFPPGTRLVLFKGLLIIWGGLRVIVFVWCVEPVVSVNNATDITHYCSVEKWEVGFEPFCEQMLQLNSFNTSAL